MTLMTSAQLCPLAPRPLYQLVYHYYLQVGRLLVTTLSNSTTIYIYLSLESGKIDLIYIKVTGHWVALIRPSDFQRGLEKPTKLEQVKKKRPLCAWDDISWGLVGISTLPGFGRPGKEPWEFPSDERDTHATFVRPPSFFYISFIYIYIFLFLRSAISAAEASFRVCFPDSSKGWPNNTGRQWDQLFLSFLQMNCTEYDGWHC